MLHFCRGTVVAAQIENTATTWTLETKIHSPSLGQILKNVASLQNIQPCVNIAFLKYGNCASSLCLNSDCLVR